LQGEEVNRLHQPNSICQLAKVEKTCYKTADGQKLPPKALFLGKDQDEEEDENLLFDDDVIEMEVDEDEEEEFDPMVIDPNEHAASIAKNLGQSGTKSTTATSKRTSGATNARSSMSSVAAPLNTTPEKLLKDDEEEFGGLFPDDLEDKRLAKDLQRISDQSIADVKTNPDAGAYTIFTNTPQQKERFVSIYDFFLDYYQHVDITKKTKHISDVLFTYFEQDLVVVRGFE